MARSIWYDRWFRLPRRFCPPGLFSCYAPLNAGVFALAIGLVRTTVERHRQTPGTVPATIVFGASGKQLYALAFGRDGAPAVIVSLRQVAPGFYARAATRLNSNLRMLIDAAISGGSPLQNLSQVCYSLVLPDADTA